MMRMKMEEGFLVIEAVFFRPYVALGPGWVITLTGTTVTMSKQIIPAVSAIAMGAALAGAASAAEYENTSGGKVAFYGQINPAIVSVDDGVNSETNLGDSAKSNSRLGFLIVQPLEAGTLKFNFETGLGLASTSKFGQGVSPDNIDWDRTDIRKVDVSFVTNSFGTISVGQGSMATDGVAFMDGTGTGLVSDATIGDFAGGFEFTTTAGALSGIEIGDAFGTFDGGRKGRIRYDSPSFNGFSISAAYGTEILKAGNSDDFYDIALRHKGEFGNFKVNSALGMSWTDSGGTTTDAVLASVGVAHASGISAAVAAGEEDGGANYVYAKLGYGVDLISAGKTFFSIDVYDGSDFNTAGSESSSWGIGVVQKLNKYNTEVYAGYRDYSYDDSANTYNDASAIVFGTRLKF